MTLRTLRLIGMDSDVGHDPVRILPRARPQNGRRHVPLMNVQSNIRALVLQDRSSVVCDSSAVSLRAYGQPRIHNRWIGGSLLPGSRPRYAGSRHQGCCRAVRSAKPSRCSPLLRDAAVKRVSHEIGDSPTSCTTELAISYNNGVGPLRALCEPTPFRSHVAACGAREVD